MAVEDPDSGLVSINTTVNYNEQGIPVQFPFTPYPAQKQMISKMIQAFEHCQNAILESPTGSGKSLAILVASLAWIKYKAENVVEAPTNNDAESVNPLSNEADLSWMGADADKFKLLISQGRFDSAFELYNTRKLNRPKPVIQSSKRISGTKWNPSSRDDIPKIYIASRTHKQLAQLIKELKNKTAYAPKMSVLGSRKQYCINDTVKDKENIDDACKTKVEHKSCAPYKDVAVLEGHPNIQPTGVMNIWDIEDLVQLGTKTHACPYFASRGIAEKAEVVFCPYNYLIDPMIRKSMGIEVKNSIIIIDEAHNIESTARDTATFETSTSVIGLMQSEIKEVLRYKHLIESNTVLASFLSIIRNWMERSDFTFGDGEKDNKLAQCFTGDAMIKEFEKMTLSRKSFFEIYLPAFQKVLSHFEDQNSKEKNSEAVEVEEQNPDGTITVKLVVKNKKTISGRSIRVFEKLFTILQFIFDQENSRSNDYTLAVLKKKQTVGRQSNDLDFCLWCMNSGVIFTGLAEEAHSIILTSGTLSPMETFESELEVKFPIQLITDHVIDKSQVWANALGSGPSNYVMTGTYQQAKQPKYLEEVSLSICNVVESIPYGVLCFFPSYAALNSLYNYINTTPTIKQRIAAKKRIFLEPQNKPTSEFNDMLQEYYDCIKRAENNISSDSTNGALFFAVYRGKVSEGIDFNDNNCRGVVCIGIPFPSYGDKLVQLKRQYNDKKKQLAPTAYLKSKILSGSDWYDIQGYRALNQALGRCIRHRKDWGAIILLENRFCDYRHSKRLSKWITPLLQKRSGNFKGAMEELLQFVNKHNWKSTKGYRLGGDEKQNENSVNDLSVKPKSDWSFPKELTLERLIDAYKKITNQKGENALSFPSSSSHKVDAKKDDAEKDDAQEDDIDYSCFEHLRPGSSKKKNDTRDDDMDYSCFEHLRPGSSDKENDTGEDDMDYSCFEDLRPSSLSPDRYFSIERDMVRSDHSAPQKDSLAQSESTIEKSSSTSHSHPPVDQSKPNGEKHAENENTKAIASVSEQSKNTAESANVNSNSKTAPPSKQTTAPITVDLTDSPETPPQVPMPMPPPPMNGQMVPLLAGNYGPPPGYNGPWHIVYRPAVAPDGTVLPPQPFIVYGPPPNDFYYRQPNSMQPRPPPPLMPAPPMMSPQNQQFAAHNQQYAAQNQQYAAQNQQYAAQNQQYTAQNQQYAAQNQQHAAQNQQYAAQNQQYAAQNQQYAAQNQPYAAQSQQHTAQNQQYATQNQQHVVQNQQHAAQNQQHTAQNQPYAAQNQHYAAPVQAPPPTNMPHGGSNAGQTNPLNNNSVPVRGRDKGKMPIQFLQPIVNHITRPLVDITRTRKDKGKEVVRQADNSSVHANNTIARPQQPSNPQPASNAPGSNVPVNDVSSNNVASSKTVVREPQMAKSNPNDSAPSSDGLPPEKPIKTEPEHYRMANSTSSSPKSKSFVVYHIKRKYLDFDSNGVPSLKKIVPPSVLKPMSKPHIEVTKENSSQNTLPAQNSLSTGKVEAQISTSLQNLNLAPQPAQKQPQPNQPVNQVHTPISARAPMPSAPVQQYNQPPQQQLRHILPANATHTPPSIGTPTTPSTLQQGAQPAGVNATNPRMQQIAQLIQARNQGTLSSTTAHNTQPARQNSRAAPTPAQRRQQNIASERAYLQNQREEARQELEFLLGSSSGSRNPFRGNTAPRNAPPPRTPSAPTPAAASQSSSSQARKLATTALGSVSKNLIEALNTLMITRRGRNKQKKAKAERDVKKFKLQFDASKLRHAAYPDIVESFNAKVAEVEARADEQLRTDSEALAQARYRAREALQAQIWGHMDVYEKLVAKRLADGIDYSQLDMSAPENASKRMVDILTRQYKTSYGDLPPRNSNANAQPGPSSSAAARPSTTVPSSTATSSSSRAASSSKAATSPSKAAAPKTVAPRTKAARSQAEASSSTASSSASAATSSRSGARNSNDVTRQAPATPKFKSELSIAGRNISFSSSSAGVKSEPGTSSNANGESSSSEVKPEPGTKRSNDDSVVEFVETASGLILPKRRKKK